MGRAALVGVVVASVLAPGCGTARMAVAPGLADRAEPLAVTGHSPRRWSQPLQLGPWRTLEVAAGDEWGWLVDIAGVALGETRRPVRLVLAGPEDRTTQVACLAERLELSRDGLAVDLGFGRRPLIVCSLADGAGERWELALTESSGRLRGSLWRGTSPRSSGYEVRSVHRIEGAAWSSAEPVGYELARADRVLAAVETINAGRVWIAPDLEPAERQRLAAAAAALLLLEPPEMTE